MKTQLDLARQCLTLAGTPFTEETLTGGWTKLRIQNTPDKCPEENLRRFFPSPASTARAALSQSADPADCWAH